MMFSLARISQAERAVYHDMVAAPGKYEACPDYVPFYMELVRVDCSNETLYTDTGEAVSVFYLDDDDAQAWPELAGLCRLYLWTCSDGFVCHHTETPEYAGAFAAALSGDELEAGESLDDFAARAVLDAMADAMADADCE